MVRQQQYLDSLKVDVMVVNRIGVSIVRGRVPTHAYREQARSYRTCPAVGACLLAISLLLRNRDWHGKAGRQPAGLRNQINPMMERRLGMNYNWALRRCGPPMKPDPLSLPSPSRQRQLLPCR